MPKKKKLTTRELKHDALIDRYQRIAEWVIRRKAPILKLALRASVLLVVVLLLLLAASRREASAVRKMAEAVEILNAEVGSAPPTDPTRKHYATEEEKYRAALASFRALSDKWYYRFAAGRELARYYAAICQLHLDPSKGEAELKALAQGHSTASRMAMLALAEHHAAGGRYDEAEQFYRKLTENPGDLPKPPIELAYARVLQYRGKKSEAVDLCVRIANEYRTEEDGRQAIEQLAQLDPTALDRIPPETTPKPAPDRLAKYKKK